MTGTKIMIAIGQLIKVSSNVISTNLLFIFHMRASYDRSYEACVLFLGSMFHLSLVGKAQFMFF
jgi:hypothetical protein